MQIKRYAGNEEANNRQAGKEIDIDRIFAGAFIFLPYFNSFVHRFVLEQSVFDLNRLNMS